VHGAGPTLSKVGPTEFLQRHLERKLDLVHQRKIAI